MTKPKILVTGATGRTGGQVAAQLLSEGYCVRAFVRSEDQRSRQLRAAGCEVILGDLADPEQLLVAMRGAQRGYFLPPFDPYMIQSATAFAVAAEQARLEAVVVLSQWLANPQHPSLSTRQHWLTDRMFSMLPGIAVTTINPGFFADMPYMSLIRYAAQLGVFPFPARGSSRDAPPSVDDIARVAVAALKDPGRCGGRRYRPTGPEMLSLEEMAAVMGKVLARPVRHINMPLWMFYKAARMDGFEPFLLSQMGFYMRDHARGAFELGGPTTDVLELTGRTPETFEAITRRCAARPDAQRTAGNSLRTLAGFLSVPMRPGFNPDRFASALCMPMAWRPELSADSALWHQEHVEPGSTSARLQAAGARRALAEKASLQTA